MCSQERRKTCQFVRFLTFFGSVDDAYIIRAMPKLISHSPAFKLDTHGKDRKIPSLISQTDPKPHFLAARNVAKNNSANQERDGSTARPISVRVMPSADHLPLCGYIRQERISYIPTVK
jgi:hypothetical protein